MKTKNLILLSAIILGLFCAGCTPAQQPEPVPEPVDYLTASPYQLGFLAAGTGGRLDKVDAQGAASTLETGTRQTLRDIALGADSAVIVGDGGSAFLLDSAGTLSPLPVNSKKALTATCFFKDANLISAENTLLRATDFAKWDVISPDIQGNITGLAANETLCVGVTDSGEVLTSTDGEQWSILDYNASYHQTMAFEGIEVCRDIFWAFGTLSDGTSQVVMSVEGGVWSERVLEVFDGQTPVDMTQTQVQALCWDGQQVIAACSDGQTQTLPDCTECNMLQKVSETPLNAIASQGGKLLVAGNNGTLKLLDTEAVRQYGIKSAAALEKQQNGAVIIDVRGAEDYVKKHIAGSIHIDSAELEQQLKLQYPDLSQEIIFYCSAGVRSQSALEKALDLGYGRVYNLGAIDNWTHEFESVT